MKKNIFALTFLLAGIAPAFAGEGMWTPQQIPQLAGELQKLGIKIDPNKLADLTGDPMGAVVSLGGCSASFVSPLGLVVTNHHCAYGAIQYNSTPDRDLLTNGFLAATMQDEVQAGPGTRVFVTTAIEDVTKLITGEMPKKVTDAERYKLMDRRKKQLVETCEKQGGVRCTVPAFFEGAQFLKITQMEIKDVRLVYAPAGGVGNFGGETDNWMWPRHTGDFSFYRAYVGRDGKPADFSKDNVPYQPKHFLKVSTAGVSDGDLVIVAGYPGRTFRYRTADEVKTSQEFSTPMTIRYARDLNAILDTESKRSKDVEIRNASRIKGNANTLKNYEGTMEVFSTGKIMAQRIEREKKLEAFLASSPEARKKYGSSLSEIARLNDQMRVTRERDMIFGWLYRSSPLLAQASTLHRLSIEKKKANIDRVVGYQERDWSRIREGVERAQKSLDVASDKAGLRYFLTEASKLPAGQRIKAVDERLAATGAEGSAAQIDKFLEQLYAGTKTADLSVRQAMLGETTEQLKARRDSMVDFAAALSVLSLEREERERAFDGAMSRVRPNYLEALREMNGKIISPDANGTLRITFGTVKGYRPRDAVWYTPQTTLAGILRKDTGKDEFFSPKALLSAARDSSKTSAYTDPQLRDVPVNFLSNVDTTGGNSGSPTLNASGEFTGLLFDGNYEALGSDYLVDPEVTRSIHVDAVYMLWVMDAVDKAHNLLKEMNVPVRYAQ